MENQLKVNDIVLITIKKIGINGEGVGYYKRLAVFVEGALVDEEVEIIITEMKERYAFGEITKIKKKSPHRVEEKHPILAKCGGVTMQHMTYAEQLVQKRNMLIGAFEQYYEGDLSKVKFYDTLGMEDSWEYRNKTQLPVRHDGEKVVVGMYQHKTNRLVYLDELNIENKLVQSAMKDILKYLTDSSIDVYNPRFKQGNLRYIIIRGFEETNEVQATFVLMKEEQRIINILKKITKLDNIKSVNYTINSDPKSIEIINNKVINIAGVDKIKGKLGKLDLLISPEAFFQLNTKQSIVMYDEVIKAANLKGFEKVLDLYCGIGSIGLYLADKVKEVKGIDNNRDNIENAREFAKMNGIENSEFHYGEILPHLHSLSEKGYFPDVVIVDPPRRGMELNILNYLRVNKVRKIIYVSCNPATLAKNINHLQKSYDLKYVVPLDMFPNTPQVESISLLERR
jgi:23S rRNA (uracil-5-)-methyltransferase RumA